jgi:hypothetical protein
MLLLFECAMLSAKPLEDRKFVENEHGPTGIVFCDHTLAQIFHPWTIKIVKRGTWIHGIGAAYNRYSAITSLEFFGNWSCTYIYLGTTSGYCITQTQI